MYVMERVFRRVYCNPTDPLNPTLTPNVNYFPHLPKKKKRGKYKTKQKLVTDIKSTII